MLLFCAARATQRINSTNLLNHWKTLKRIKLTMKENKKNPNRPLPNERGTREINKLQKRSKFLIYKTQLNAAHFLYVG